MAPRDRIASSGDLAADLAALGLAPGDKVMVHASMRAIGPVAGGPRGVLDALAAVLGPDGTLLMPLGADVDWWWVNNCPPAERPALLSKAMSAGAEPFDALTTPAEPEIGVLAEAFRTWDGTKVSDHPDGRMGAHGPLAYDFLKDQTRNHYLGPGSPLDKLVAAGGKVLRMGADLNTTTLLHLAEYLCAVPNKRSVLRHHAVRTPNGVEICTVECLDDSDGIVEWDDGDYFETLLKDYWRGGHGARGRVGNAPSELLDAGHLLGFAVEWMNTHLGARPRPREV